MAKDANSDGTHFPVFGICRGEHTYYTVYSNHTQMDELFLGALIILAM